MTLAEIQKLVDGRGIVKPTPTIKEKINYSANVFLEHVSNYSLLGKLALLTLPMIGVFLLGKKMK